MLQNRFVKLLNGASVLAAVLLFATGAQAQGKWTAAPEIPEGANEVIGATVNEQVLVYGGQDAKSAPMGILWRFDPAVNQWSQLPSNATPYGWLNWPAPTP